MFSNIPETLLVSAGCTLLPARDGYVAAFLRLADGELMPLGVPAEEGSAGVAGDPTIVDPGSAQLLLANFAHYQDLVVNHFFEKDQKAG